MSKEAMKLALEALEGSVTPDFLVGQKEKKDKAITAIKEALAQPEQEPVEWGVDWGKDGNSVSIIKRLTDGNIEVLAWEYAPHLPQRTWVGLTDEEIEDCYKQGGIGRAIQMLKEKNT